jgi:hypothetical protein
MRFGIGLLLLAAACGPVQYVSDVTLDATRAVRNAKEAHAADLAPYEYTFAAESLHKARELAGQSRWQEALRFGADAIKYGHEAEHIAREKSLRPGETRNE